ncbi:MAG: extracellular solute-binding protein [Eubacteriales bacterium]|nr:extracellular solute-binding protein [Eubacteriales bacterium]
MRRFALLLLLCAAALLQACATAENAEPVRLTVWVGDNQDQPWLEQAVQRFKDAHPDTSYEIQPGVVGEGDAKSTVLTDVEAAADVFTFADDQFNDLVNARVLQAVENPEEIIAENGGEDSAAVQAASSGGTLYAYPATADNGYFMFYNTQYFSESDVQTLDAMLDKAAQSGKYVGFPLSNGWYLYSFFKGAGLTLSLDEDGVTNRCNWNATDTPITGVQVVEALRAIASHPGFRDADSDPFVAGLKDGSIIAGVSGVWNANAAAEVWGEHYAAAKLPTYTVAGRQAQMGSFAGFKMIGVSSYSAHVGDAMDLAAFLTSYDSQLLRFRLRSQGPSNVRAAESAEVQANPAIAALAAQAAYADVQRVGDNYWSAAATLGKILAKGESESADAQALLDTAAAGITAAPTK